MDLIIGGAFQGKLEYARKKYNLKKSDVCECSIDKEPDLSKRCINRFERYILWCMRNDKEPQMSFPDDKIIILNDIFCGVIPIEKEARAWREACGRAGTALAASANSVTRLFCGIPKKIK